ncbi:unnamed protein product [Arctogadus glacialis]
MRWDFIPAASGPSPIPDTALSLSFTVKGSVLTAVPQVNLPVLSSQAPACMCVRVRACVCLFVGVGVGVGVGVRACVCVL